MSQPQRDATIVHVGTVKMYDPIKGSGLITPQKGVLLIPVRKDGIAQGGPSKLKPGMKVEYELGGEHKATNLLVTSTTFYLIRCLEDPRPGGPDVDNLPQIVSSPEACLQQCRYDYEAYLRPHTEDDLYDCRCGNYSPNNATEGNCGRGSTIGLSHEAGSFVRGDPSTPSDYVVKKRNLNRLSRKAVDLCPKGLMAYKLAKEQAGDAFECIDPNQELESCGGCLHGQVGTDSPAFGVGVE
nr:uncharacterized protein CI109_006094 [Kwoniella shandongensis]KAA5525521.1 hypothetical protein CI109_006094 [Kwoniella shandongensis]